MRRHIATLLVVLLAVVGCSLLDREQEPSTSATAEVDVDGFALELRGLTVRAPAGVAPPGTTVRVEEVPDPHLPELDGSVAVAGPTVEVTLGDELQPAQHIALEYTGTEMDDALAVLTEADDGKVDLFPVTAESGIPTAAVDHLSVFTLITVDVEAFWSGLARSVDAVLGVRTPAPHCPGEARVGTVVLEAAAEPPGLVWPCLWTDADGVHLRVTPATGVPYSIRADSTGRIASTPGPSVGSMASLAFFDLLSQGAPTGLASPGGHVTVTTSSHDPVTVAQARSHAASLLVESLIYGIDLGLTAWGVSALPWEDVGELECAGGLISAGGDLSDNPQAATFTSLARSVVACAQQLVSDHAGQATFSRLTDRGASVLLGIVGSGAGLLWSQVRGLVGELSGEGLVTISITPRPAPLDDAALLGAPAPSLCEHAAGTLFDGALPGIAEPDGHVSIGRPEGSIPTDRVVYGDLDGDGEREAAVVVSCSRGGVPWPESIVVYGPGPTYLGHVDLGDLGRERPHVDSLRVADGRVEARIVGFVGPGDGACCGRIDAVAQIALTDGDVDLAEIRYFDERDTVAALIGALEAGDRAEARRLSAEESIADFLFDSYAGTALKLGECRPAIDHSWGDVACDMEVSGSDEPPAELFLSKVGFAQWQMEAFLSPRFVSH